jgi:hypothetical protein
MVSEVEPKVRRGYISIVLDKSAYRQSVALVGFCINLCRKNHDLRGRCEPSVQRSLHGKKSSVRRFLGVLHAKRNRLPGNKKKSEIALRLNGYKKNRDFYKISKHFLTIDV